MTAAELNSEVTASLQQLAIAGDLGVLLGAGASLAAGLPSWNELAVELLTLSNAIEDSETANQFLRGQDPALAAEAAKAATDNWPSLVRRALYGEALEEPEPTSLHLAVAWLAVSRREGGLGTGLYTLNFDSLIEKAYEALDPQSEVFSRGTSSPRASGGQVEVHHLHGSLPVQGTSAAGIILTLSDFTELSSSANPWQVAVLQEQLQRGPLLLAGTSYRDPDIRQWLHNLRRADPDGTDGKLFIFLAREGLGLSRREFAKIRNALVEQWEAIGVRVLVTHDHADAAQALHELLWVASNPDETYAPPQARASSLWSMHQQNFEVLQREHAQQLADDVELLRAQLGPQASLTLWLSDGEGHIVRWASNDRQYQDVELLVHVPAGFDSDWIVGQCLSSEDTLALPLSEAATRRWRSVVATPVGIQLPGGPFFSAAALSSATPLDLDNISPEDQDRWRETIEALAAKWGSRLSETFASHLADNN